MKESQAFGLLVLVAAAAGLTAVLSSRLGDRIRIPMPVVFLVGAALARLLVGGLRAPPDRLVERVVTIALLLVLFDGGRQIGWSRFRAAAAPIAIVGVLGTFLTVAAIGLLVHLAFGLDWYLALLVSTAVSPTDPAVVFSVLGQREIAGRSSTILEGESGANDPVGISLMVSLIAAGGVSASALGHVGISFLLQMSVGALVGILGGLAVRWHTGHVSLPSEGLYPLRTLAAVMVLFGIATVAHGSGFLAVFAAGVVLGDAPGPYKREIERFHAALASLGEIVAFLLLGLAIDLNTLTHTNVWLPGLIIGTALALVIRPLLVGICLLPARLRRNEQAFVLFAGLKGAVPILLATFILAAHTPHAERLFGIVVVVVLFSVIVQGSLVPTVAYRLRLPMRLIEPAPWALGVRLHNEPEATHPITIAADSAAVGHTVAEFEQLTDHAQIGLIVRDSSLVPINNETRLRAGDTVLVLVHTDHHLDKILQATTTPTPPKNPANSHAPQNDNPTS
jgi:cell volume regulation protein A